MLSDSVLLEAGHPLYCSEYANEHEERGGRFPPGCRLDHYIDHAPEDKLLPIMKGYERDLAKAWGMEPSEIFRLMGIEDDETRQADALYLVMMACVGHGIGLNDGDFDEELDAFLVATGKVLDVSPMHYKFTELWDLACEVLGDVYEDD